MSTFVMVLCGWFVVSAVFSFVFWPRWAEFALPRNERTITKCKACGHVQRCCAPPCERCHSMNIEII